MTQSFFESSLAGCTRRATGRLAPHGGPVVLVVLMALLGLTTRVFARGADRALRAGLAHVMLHGDSPALRDRVRGWLDDLDQIATDRDGGSRWIAADDTVVVVDGRAMDHGFGEIPRVEIMSGGGWMALGPAAALVHGVFHDDPELIEALSGRRASGTRPGEAVPAGPRPTDTPVEVEPVRASVVRDTQPPVVQGLRIIASPDDPARRRVLLPGPDAFVGAEMVLIEVTMSERMGVAPRVQVAQNGAPPVLASLDFDRNPVFGYRYTPFSDARRNGPARLEVLGAPAGTSGEPAFGVDEAGNPIAPGDPGSVQGSAFRVDTVPPDLRRVDVRIPGAFRSLPRENEVLPKSGFPREILVLVQDYDQPDDGTFAGANVETGNASGIDFDRAARFDSSLRVRLFKPDGQEIPGTLVAAPPISLRLLLPDVYDPGAGVFPDTDRDGRADPQEGTYRIEVDLVDRVGNQSLETLPLASDTTPVPSGELSVSIQPVFTEPFPNPVNPLPDSGTSVRQLRQVIVTASAGDFDPTRSTARLLSRLTGAGTVPREVKTSLERQDRTLILTVELDQDGDGNPDFENPPPGPFLPPGTPDPRFGLNDGPYLVEVEAFDRAGNRSVVQRELLLDTTRPEVGTTFPGSGLELGPPLRIVDAILMDPAAASGNDGAGIRLGVSDIRLRFQGNSRSPSRLLDGVVFVHEPNSTDPTRPDFDPDDRFPKILFELTDKTGQVVSLPSDGSMDGVYEIEVDVVDRAGNDRTGVTTFSFSSSAPPTTSPLAITRFTAFDPDRP